MYWISFKRIIKSGFFSFWRNGFVSLSSVFVMVIALGVLGSIIFLGALLNSSLGALQEKVDVNVYFVNNAEEPEILSLKTKIETLPEVGFVSYISREKALEDFKTRHENDATTLQALDELDENPLGAVLNIRAKKPSQYEDLANFLKGDNILSPTGKNIVEKVNYNQNKVAIDRLTSLMASAQKIGLGIMIVLILMALLITFNTIRLAIYIAREEISVMKLVGASSTYIRGPFIVGGMLYGLIAGIITLVLFYPVTAWLGKETANFFIGINIFDYYISNFGQIFLIIIVSGVVIGAISSFLAVRRYLH